MTTKPQPPAYLPEHVKQLMREWAGDDSWELETTDGFSPYYDDLLNFSDAMHAYWEARQVEQLVKYAGENGCADNLPLAKKLMELENRLDANQSLRTELYDKFMQHDHGESASRSNIYRNSTY